MRPRSEHERRREIVRAFSDPGVDRWEHRVPNFRLRVIGTTPISGVHIGREGIEKGMGAARDRLASQHVYVDDVIGEGNRFVKIMHTEGMTVDGRPYRNEYAIVFIFDGDKVVEGTEYLDTALVSSLFEEAAEDVDAGA